jgi:4-cresol dehydrogenase (hydroxylating) flavoprotein subunit
MIEEREDAVRAAPVHFPQSVAEVVALVERAARESRHLYPVSTGLNWGYGDTQPTSPGSDIVNLSRMNRILNADEISTRNPVAVIEAGVTQGQLFDFLAKHCPQLTFNVTGSARATSILGNALDRGVGYLGPRCEDIFGLEVVLGTGRVIRTGFRRLGDESPLAHSHPHGNGPALDGLFFQGNFGIVTSACFRLVPRRPVQIALSIRLPRDEDFAALIDILCELKRENVLPAVTHVGNRARARSTLQPGIRAYLQTAGVVDEEWLSRESESALRFAVPCNWAGFCEVSGTPAEVRARVAEIRRRLRGIAKVTVVTAAKLTAALRACRAASRSRWARVRAAALDAITPLHGLALGIPTDAPVQNLMSSLGQTTLPAAEFAQSNCGLIYVSPALPMRGDAALATVSAMAELAKGFGHDLQVTVNVESKNSLVAVTNLTYDKRDAAAVQTAIACARALERYIRGQSLELYRAHIDAMPETLTHTPSHWAALAALKLAFDPGSVVAPGRYSIDAVR